MADICVQLKSCKEAGMGFWKTVKIPTGNMSP